MIEVDQSVVATGVGSVGSLLIGGRVLFSWWKKQNFNDSAAAAHDGLLDRIQADAEHWRKLYDETHKLLEEQRETNSLLRNQNNMMRLLLIQKGLSLDELTAIGVMS